MTEYKVSFRQELNKAVKVQSLLIELLSTLDADLDNEIRAWDKTDAALAFVDELVVELRKLYND